MKYSLMFFLLAAAPAWAQKAQVQWATDWEKARTEAQARNVPILWTLHQDG